MKRPVMPPADAGIRHITVANFHLRFEYHPASRRLYYVRKKPPGLPAGTTEDATLLGLCEDYVLAGELVRIFMVGYRVRQEEGAHPGLPSSMPVRPQ